MNSVQNVSVNKVIKYIELHLNESMDIEKLAKVAGYSPYHFSRIFKQATGENIASMIKRLRLSQGVKQLLNLDMPVTEVGQETGYETPSSFNKVFKQTFGYSPSQYREKARESLQKTRQELEGTPEIITSEEKLLVCSRELGEYGDAAYKAWAVLLENTKQYEQSHKITIHTKDMQTFGLCYDLPNITEEDKMRYEASILVSEKLDDLPQGLYMKQLPKGRYAKYRYQGSYDDLYKIWPRFYGWIQEQNVHLANFPPIEKYCDDIDLALQQKVQNPIIELYLLLK